MAKPVLLLVDDNESFQASLRRLLRRDYELRPASTLDQAMGLLAPLPDLALVDLCLDEAQPANRDGLALLQHLSAAASHVPVVIITGHGEIEAAVDCMRAGAVDFLRKPCEAGEIRVRLSQALQRRELVREVAQLRQDLGRLSPNRIVGNSPEITELLRVIEAVGRDGEVTVLVRGETGTGKELVARGIHASGPRRKGPFVPVMLNALPTSMIEAELFGHEAGAYTDAREGRAGYLEQAQGGVLFLDEIGEVEPSIQIKLLRLLEAREFQRLGSTTTVTLDAQIVTATNANLEVRVQSGEFREDLYYRLKVHEVVLPPLRHRTGDLKLLVEHYLELFHQQGKRLYRVSAEALALLEEHPWPGNVRELRNVLEAAVFRAEMDGEVEVGEAHLPTEIRRPRQPASSPADDELGPGDAGFRLDIALGRTELRLVAQALQLAGGRKTEAWRTLGLNDRFALRRRVQRIFRDCPDLCAEFGALAESFGQGGSV